MSNLMLKGDTSGAHGFLMFEDPDSETNGEFVDGFKLGALLKDTGVPVLVLNACQSAFAEATPEPDETRPEATRNEIEGYGSLAQAVMEAGAAGVVAMRYSVYVVTAAQFVAELYGALARGRRLGEAVTWARKNLANQPERRIAYEARPLQDWCVPVVWERAPLRLWPEKADAAPIKIKSDDGAAVKAGALDRTLPQRPDVGFYGRDETLYALDRAFDRHKIVLLHAYAGSGKTTTAAEFARWYALTGGVTGPILFTSFERHLPLARVLDKIGDIFGQVLERSGIQWDAIIDTTKRKDIALQLLDQVPVLWIWDNVEPITGFPAGIKSEWSAAEQQELRAFLSAARDTKAKFILTSRRDEESWLGSLAKRVAVPPMPIQERLQLAAAIIERRGQRLANLPDLTQLLRFTRGNPLTILVIIGEALRAGIDTKQQVDVFIDVLRKGEAAFEDEETEGRSRSLGASLSYGFRHSFNESERKILALLHLFQGFVDVDVLHMMGNPEVEWCLQDVRGLTRQRGIALLDCAAEVGLLDARGGGYYGIHPALPWYFRGLFERYYPAKGSDAERARGAFMEAMGALGSFYHHQYSQGHREALHALTAEEDNLLATWRLACERTLWKIVLSAMQGLLVLYGATGRHAAWRRLVDDVVPHIVDPATDGSLPGLQQEWSLVNDYRVRLAWEDHDWPQAERLLRASVEWNRERAREALEIAPEARDDLHRNAIRSLAVSLELLGSTFREQNNPACSSVFQEAFEYYASIGARQEQAVCAFNLGHVYSKVASLHDLDEAERWYQRSRDMRAPGDESGRGKCIAQLGLISYIRFTESRRARRPVDELAHHLTEAARFYNQALKMIPETDIISRGIAHNQLGNIYNNVGDIDNALHHYRQDIHYAEKAGDIFGAAQTRYNVASTLLNAARLDDASVYADAAITNFRTFGERAADYIQKTEELIASINKARAEGGHKPQAG